MYVTTHAILALARRIVAFVFTLLPNKHPFENYQTPQSCKRYHELPSRHTTDPTWAQFK